MPIHHATEPASAPIGQATPPLLKLQQFCGDFDGLRHFLAKPFSRDGFTWATNGIILVRVALRPDVPDVDKKFNIAGPLQGIEETTFFRPSFELPPVPAERKECGACEGSGRAHECPNCGCVCEMCNGAGELDPEKNMSACIGPTPFNLNYVRQMLALPGIEIAALPEQISAGPYFFRFEGGVGALMPLRIRREGHVDLKLTAELAPAETASVSTDR